jgi:hypothetical protein
MTELLNVGTWSLLQWVLVVLAAGFIGQFGKSFAQFLMAKVKARKTGVKEEVVPLAPAAKDNLMPEKLAAPTEKVETEPETPAAILNQAMPPESADPGRDSSTSKEIISGQSAPPVPDKKALKAVLKQQKKTAKALKK